jgi:hypothetical protein
MVGVEVRQHDGARLLQGNAGSRQVDRERSAGVQQNGSIHHDRGVVRVRGDGRAGSQKGDLHLRDGTKADFLSVRPDGSRARDTRVRRCSSKSG